jgi:phosphoglycerol transferase MdoB-like AlkP superfamily enzyme
MKSFIDMHRATLLYGAGVIVLMLLSLAMSNIPELQLSQHFEFAARRKVAAVLAGAGAMTGMFAMLRHLARGREPHRVPQSQVSIAYLGFFIFSLAAVLLAK